MKFFISSTRYFIDGVRPRAVPDFLLVLSLFLAVAFSPLTSWGEVNLNAYPDRGYPAPEFTLVDLKGKKHSLSDYKGRVVVLNVWATWCGPCRVEMPAMESMNNKLKGDKFALLAESIDQTGAGAIRRFVEESNLTFPILLALDGGFQSLYMTNSIPLTFIIDKTGTIVSRVPGAREWDSPEALEALKELINK